MDDRLELKNQSKTSDDPKVLQKYRKSRNEIKEKNKSEKKSHYQNKFKKANDENDRSQMWNTAYEILGSKKNLSPTQLVIDGKLCSNPQKMAEEFNKVFIEKVKNLKNNLSGQVSIDPADRLKNWLKKREDEIPLLEFRTVKEEDLIKYIQKLKGKKSCGFDQIDSCLLKTAAPYIKDVLLHVINLNIQNHFSIGWKTQLILPNYKKGDKLSAENYRPVSNIPELSKVLEYAIFDQLMEHFLSNNLFHPNHHGFLPYHNTSTALAQMFDLWVRAAEDQELSATLLLDLSAAFDLIDHKVLLKKLKLYGLSDNSIKFIKSYLSDRQQVVQVETKLSEPKMIGDIAVPQGSILGGLLFLIFQNDFPASSDEGESVLYADDDSDIVSDKDPDILQEKIQMKADKSTEWFRDNGMVCSGEKTKLLVMGTRDQRKTKLILREKVLQVRVCGKIVKESSSERLLGLSVQNDMSWNVHLHGNGLTGDKKTIGLLGQLSQRLGILKKLKMFMLPQQFKATSNGMFGSKLSFGIEVFGNVWGLPSMDDEKRRFSGFTKDDNRRLQVLQNKLLRLKTNLDYKTPTEVLVKTCNELSVQQTTAYHTLTTVFKAVQFKKPFYLAQRLKQRKPTSDGIFPHRQLNNIHTQAELTLSRGGLVYRGAKLWNCLTPELKREENLQVFKRNVRRWVTENVPAKPP